MTIEVWTYLLFIYLIIVQKAIQCLKNKCYLRVQSLKIDGNIVSHSIGENTHMKAVSEVTSDMDERQTIVLNSCIRSLDRVCVCL